MLFDCKKCGKVESVLVDGYCFGDTLLEGVMFRVDKKKNGDLVAAVEPEFKGYCRKLNTKHWLEECIHFIENMEGDVAGSCPHCGDDIYLEVE